MTMTMMFVMRKRITMRMTTGLLVTILIDDQTRVMNRTTVMYTCVIIYIYI